MTELREISYRRIRAILRLTEIESRLGIGCCSVIPVSEHIHYLRCGSGLVIYMIDGDVAHMHGALTPGDGHHVGGVWPSHLQYLRGIGVHRITTMHKADHRRASMMCRALGFTPVPGDEGFKRYERTI